VVNLHGDADASARFDHLRRLFYGFGALRQLEGGTTSQARGHTPSLGARAPASAVNNRPRFAERQRDAAPSTTRRARDDGHFALQSFHL